MLAPVACRCCLASPKFVKPSGTITDPEGLPRVGVGGEAGVEADEKVAAFCCEVRVSDEADFESGELLNRWMETGGRGLGAATARLNGLKAIVSSEVSWEGKAIACWACEALEPCVCCATACLVARRASALAIVSGTRLVGGRIRIACSVEKTGAV